MFVRTQQSIIDRHAMKQNTNCPKTVKKQLLSTRHMKELVKNIGIGLPFESACRIIEKHPKTVTKWLQTGYKEDYEREEYFDKHGEYPPTQSVHHELYKKIERAYATFESVHLQNIANAGFEGDWRASAELLKLRIPTRYNPAIVQHQHTTQVESSSNIKHVFVHHQEAESEEDWIQTVDSQDHKKLLLTAEQTVDNETNNESDMPEILT